MSPEEVSILVSQPDRWRELLSQLKRWRAAKIRAMDADVVNESVETVKAWRRDESDALCEIARLVDELESSGPEG